ncbi:AP endonuclease [Schizopora paradoxa]|uniref:Apurinic-apyrimidinic endonuclease 1 n=1 Tax=Schizopora paradoxa TaxID=27342 RepID=A0A0H2RXH7_9AGAM|nr:AP endonuclease [Schizopora paradoxa]
MATRRSSRLSSSSNLLTKRRKLTPSVNTNVAAEFVEGSSSSTIETSNVAGLGGNLVLEVQHIEEASTTTKKTARKRKLADFSSEPLPNFDDVPPRPDNALSIGAHVSAAGGPHNAVINAAKLGANAFALFLKSQRKWTSKPLEDEHISLFKQRMVTYKYTPDQVLPHGSYLINLANPDAEKREKSYECFLDDLKRCEQLGLTLYNFHPGSTVGAADAATCISHLADALNRAHEETSSVVTVIENMAGAGNVLGARFADIANIIRQVKDKSRVGVCLDTCHLYAAGFDIRTKEGVESTLTQFNDEVGLSYLRGIHLNDSKGTLGSHKDRHGNIGLGELGLPSFRALFHALSNPASPFFLKRKIPMVLETPLGPAENTDIWKTEISVLNRVVDMLVVKTAKEGTEERRKGKEEPNGENVEKGKMKEELDELVEEVRRAVGGTRPTAKKSKKSSAKSSAQNRTSEEG